VAIVPVVAARLGPLRDQHVHTRVDLPAARVLSLADQRRDGGRPSFPGAGDKPGGAGVPRRVGRSARSGGRTRRSEQRLRAPAGFRPRGDLVVRQPSFAVLGDAVPVEQVADEGEVGFRYLGAPGSRRRFARVAVGELLRDKQVDAVRLAADLLFYPGELGVEFLRGVGGGGEGRRSPPALVTAATTGGASG